NPLYVRIGLNTGDVISEDDDYFGSSVIAAARIAGEAKGGEILLSEATRAVAGRIRVPLVDRGPYELRGLSETTRLYAAVGRPTAEARRARPGRRSGRARRRCACARRSRTRRRGGSSA